MKYRYLDMICDTIFTIGDHKGASRQAIWKHISGTQKYRESTTGGERFFRIQLKRALKDNTYLEQKKPGGGSIRLTKKYREKMIKAAKAGESVELARKHAMTKKDTNRKKPPTKNKKTKASKKVGTKAKKEQKKAAKADKKSTSPSASMATPPPCGRSTAKACFSG